MKFHSKFSKSLETSWGLGDLLSFIKVSYDGIYLVLLMIAYFIWALYLIFISLNPLEPWFGAVLMYPVLLFVVFIRQRLGTFPEDKTATFFTFISLTAISTAPIYYVFWR